uniref:Uncharacterized protein n=2 Tax=Oryza TaxID=4527 RepID=Q6UUK3_ORYSJ|nr:hypothetical protein OSJNBa0017M13.19 [Oryza sativa Japonica Group]
MPSSAAKRVRWSSSVWLDPDDNNAVTLRFDNGTEAWRYWCASSYGGQWAPKLSWRELLDGVTASRHHRARTAFVPCYTARTAAGGGRCGNAGVGQLKQRVLELDAGGVLSVGEIRVGVDEDSEPVQAWKSRMGQSSKRRSSSADDVASAAAGSSNENMAPASAPCLASQTPLRPSVAPRPASPRR